MKKKVMSILSLFTIAIILNGCFIDETSSEDILPSLNGVWKLTQVNVMNQNITLPEGYNDKAYIEITDSTVRGYVEHEGVIYYCSQTDISYEINDGIITFSGFPFSTIARTANPAGYEDSAVNLYDLLIQNLDLSQINFSYEISDTALSLSASVEIDHAILEQISAEIHNLLHRCEPGEQTITVSASLQFTKVEGAVIENAQNICENQAQ